MRVKHLYTGALGMKAQTNESGSTDACFRVDVAGKKKLYLKSRIKNIGQMIHKKTQTAEQDATELVRRV